MSQGHPTSHASNPPVPGAAAGPRGGLVRPWAAVSVAVAVLLLAAPVGGRAQQPARVYRLGILSPGAHPAPSLATSPNLVPMALRELGYIDGQNLVVERRFAEGRIDRLPVLARELVQLRVDVIVAVSQAIPAARDATPTIPIVMGFGFNPVEQGFIASLALAGRQHHRGGIRARGTTGWQATGSCSKRRSLGPRGSRFATEEADAKAKLQAARRAASALHVDLVIVEVQVADYDRAFKAMVTGRADALS